MVIEQDGDVGIEPQTQLIPCYKNVDGDARIMLDNPNTGDDNQATIWLKQMVIMHS